MGRAHAAGVNGTRWAIVVTSSRRKLLRDIGSELERRGAKVELIEDDVDRPIRLDVDGVLVGPKEPAWLEWARSQRNHGAEVVPAPETVECFRDRVFMHSLLEASGFAAPTVVTGTGAELLDRRELGLSYPVMLKRRWHHGDALVVLNSVEQLRARLLTANRAEQFVVETVVPGTHATVYFIGKEIHLFTRTAFAGETTEVLANASPPGLSLGIERLRSLTGALFGKLDLVLHEDGRVVGVDIGAFPKFLHVSEAAAAIATLL